MYSKVFVVFALVAVAQGRDLFEGANKTEERNIYDQHLQASPAIWKQTVDVAINATEHEVISKINITDLRPEKDGEIFITSGGVGHDNVSFTLKSPTILRGYDFLVQVYSIFDEQNHQASGMDAKPTPATVSTDVTEKATEKPKLTTLESKINEGATVTYPTQTPTDGTVTLATGMPTQEPISNGKPNNGKPNTNEIKMPVPTVTEVFTDAPRSEIPVEVNMPIMHY